MRPIAFTSRLVSLVVLAVSHRRRAIRRLRRFSQQRSCPPQSLEMRVLPALAIPEVLTTEVEGFIGALAVDDSRVYWIEKPDAAGGSNGALRSISKSGGPVTDLLTIAAGRDARDMALDGTDVYLLTGSDGLSKVPKIGGPEQNISNNFGIVSQSGTRRGNNPLDLAFDRGLSRLYVSNLDTQGFGSIQSVSKFGGAVTTVRRADGLGDIAGGRRSAYWFEGNTGQIASAPLVGGATRTEVSGVGTGFAGVRVLKTDADEGLYWGNGDGTVRSFVGGTQSILANDYRSINYNGFAGPLVIDDYRGNVYYHSGTTQIRYVPKTGGASEELVINTIVAAMAVDNDYLYWATDFGRIRRVPLPTPSTPAPNLAPKLSNPSGGANNFAQNGPPATVVPGATVSQPNGLGFAGGVVRYSLAANAAPGDMLELAPNGTGPGQIGLSAGAVSYGGVEIGLIAGGTGGTPLLVNLNGNASPEAIQAMLRRVTFRTTGAGVSTALRTVLIEVTNSDAWTGSITAQVGVLAVQPSANQVTMYRAYNPTADYHFFTISFPEFGNAVGNGYRDESSGRPGFAVLDNLTAESTSIHRMYNLNTGRHYYTLSDGERDFLVTVGWRFEKEEGFMSASPVMGATEIFRLYNRNSGVHLYTENPAVKDSILARFPGIWEQHQSLGYAFSFGAPAASAAATAATHVAMLPSAARASAAESLGRSASGGVFIAGLVEGPGTSPTYDLAPVPASSTDETSETQPRLNPLRAAYFPSIGSDIIHVDRLFASLIDTGTLSLDW